MSEVEPTDIDEADQHTIASGDRVRRINGTDAGRPDHLPKFDARFGGVQRLAHRHVSDRGVGGDLVHLTEVDLAGQQAIAMRSRLHRSNRQAAPLLRSAFPQLNEQADADLSVS